MREIIFDVDLLQILNSAVMFVVVLGILVFVHELGHYLAAKTVKIKVRNFSIGFGKEIFGFTRKNGERWKISVFPLGGYVDLYGMDPNDPDVKKETDPKVLSQAFFNKNAFARMWTVFAGPFANFVFAILALTVLFSTAGLKELGTKVGAVKEGYPAYQAGLESGDEILLVSGKNVSKWEELVKEISSVNPNEDIVLTIKRDDKVFDVSLPTKITKVDNIYKEKEERRVIGITASTDYIFSRELGVWDSFKEGLSYTKEFSGVILGAVKRMVTREMKADVGGPIAIAEASGKAAQTGIYALVLFLVHLSINLGLLNLLPIPLLDGGHLMYLIIEVLSFGKGLNQKIRNITDYTGMAFLLMLMVFVFYKDLERIFF